MNTINYTNVLPDIMIYSYNIYLFCICAFSVSILSKERESRCYIIFFKQLCINLINLYVIKKYVEGQILRNVKADSH